jgi:hypothetical protein
MLRAEPEEATETVRSRLPELLERLARSGDERGLAKAHIAAGWVHWLASCAVLAMEQGRLAADHARRAGDDGLRARALGLCIAPLIMGPGHNDAVAEELDKIRGDVPGPYLAAVTQFAGAELARSRGSFDEARRIVDRSIDDFRALGMPTLVSSCMSTLADVEMSDGNPAAARAALLKSDASAAELGECSIRSTIQARLAEIEWLLGDRAAAEAAIGLCDELGAQEDVINFAITHPVRAQLALSDGDLAAAERWARSAVDYAFLTDFPIIRGNAKLSLARIQAALGRPAEAATEARAALDLYTAKGASWDAAEAQAVLTELGVES